MDHPGDVADEFDLKPRLGGGPERYPINQRADDFDRFGPGPLVVEQAVEGRDLRPIDRGKLGMEPYRDFRNAGQLGRNLRLASFECLQLGLNACPPQCPGSKSLKEGIDSVLNVLLFAVESFAPMILVAPALIELVIKGPHKLRNKIRRHQLMA
jgi:hypothetical protein